MTNKDDSFEDPVLNENEILSPAEISKIKDEARASILKAKKEDARRKLLASETQRLRNEEGLTTGNGNLDEIVNITIDLPLFAPHVCINSHAYWHAQTYSVPRHVADTLRSQMFNSWKHQSEIDGKSKNAFYAEKHIAEMFRPANLTKGATLSAKTG